MQKAIRNRNNAGASVEIDYDRYTTKPESTTQPSVQPVVQPNKNFCPISHKDDNNEEIERLHAEYTHHQARIQQIQQKLYQLRATK